MLSYTVCRRLRMMVFAMIMFLSVLWAILLCVELFMHWDAPEPMQRNLLALLVVANTLSAVILPPLLATSFKPWVDVVPLSILFLAHTGAAIIYVLCYGSLTCSGEGASSKCGIVNVLILVFSWLQPIILLVYLIGLSMLLVKQRREPTNPKLFEKHLSELPMMQAPIGRDSLTSFKRWSEASKYSQSSAGNGHDPSGLPWLGPTLKTISESGEENESSLAESPGGSTRHSSGKLAKNIPNSFFQ